MDTNDSLQNRNLQQSPRNYPYTIQIGFDWGSLYSKCIYREIHNNQAFVYTLNNSDALLISSSIIFKNDTFIFNNKNIKNPENGLYNIKKVLYDISRNNYKSIFIKRFNELANLTSRTEQQNIFIKSCSVFYLSRILYRIRKDIIKKFNDFGDNKNDKIYVNLSIPISNIFKTSNNINIATRNLFMDVLCRSWDIACRNELIQDHIKRKDIEYIVIQDYNKEDLACNVFPEANACIQTLQKSVDNIDENKIYIITDIGSCNINQCCVNFNIKNINSSKSYNLLASDVFSYGDEILYYMSQNINKIINQRGRFETTRKPKKIIKTKHMLTNAKEMLATKLIDIYTRRTLLKLLQSIKNNIRQTYTRYNVVENIYFIFGGGVNLYSPYKSALLRAVAEFIKAPKDSSVNKREFLANKTINIKTPKDIKIKYNNFINFYVAYGLSFLYEDLPKVELTKYNFQEKKIYDKNKKHKTISSNNLSNQNIKQMKNHKSIKVKTSLKKEIQDEIKRKKDLRLCPYCRGQNSMCFFCDGEGFVDK